MTDKSLTRHEINIAVSDQFSMSLAEAAELVDTTIEAMSEALAEEGELKLSGFGTFTVHKKKERIGRNPKTGEQTPIAERQVILMNPSNQLKARINNKPVFKQNKI